MNQSRRSILEILKPLRSSSNSRAEAELEKVYRRYISKCDAIKNIESEVNILKHEVAHHELELINVKKEIESIGASNPSVYKYRASNAKYHNLMYLVSPLDRGNSNLSLSGNVYKDALSEDETVRYIRSCRGDICTGDVVYVGSSMKSRPEEGFAIVTPTGELLFHNDIMTIIFDKSINTYSPIQYDFIRERNIKYGNMFHYIVENKDNQIGKLAYENCFNSWRSNEEVDQIIQYYKDIGVWQ